MTLFRAENNEAEVGHFPFKTGTTFVEVMVVKDVKLSSDN